MRHAEEQVLAIVNFIRLVQLYSLKGSSMSNYSLSFKGIAFGREGSMNRKLSLSRQIEFSSLLHY